MLVILPLSLKDGGSMEQGDVMVTIRRMRDEDVEEVGRMYADFYSYHRRIMGAMSPTPPSGGLRS